MKKFLLSSLVIAALTITGCSKDDDGAPALDASLLEGTWIVEKTVYVEGEETSTEDDQIIYSFNADKTYQIRYAEGDEEDGTYSLDGHVLGLQSDDFVLPYEIKALTSNNLNLFMSIETEIEGEEEPLVYSETIYLARVK